MKNKKVISALNNVLPNKMQKQQMLDNIINSQSKKKFNKKYFFQLTSALAVICFGIFLLKTPQNDSGMVPINNRSSLKIKYNNTYYCEVGLWNKDLEAFKKVDDSNIVLDKEVYTSLNYDDIIIVYDNDLYKEYKICEGEIYE